MMLTCIEIASGSRSSRYVSSANSDRGLSPVTVEVDPVNSFISHQSKILRLCECGVEDMVDSRNCSAKGVECDDVKRDSTAMYEFGLAFFTIFGMTLCPVTLAELLFSHGKTRFHGVKVRKDGLNELRGMPSPVGHSSDSPDTHQ